MLIVVKILIAVCIWLVIPVLLGSLWTEGGRKINDAFVSTYLMGLLSEWAGFFVIAKWAVARQLTLQKLCVLWLVLLAAMTVFSVALGIQRKRFDMPDQKKGNAGQILGILGLILLCTLALVCGGSRQKEHSVEAALTMYATGTLYQYDATTGRSEDEMLSFEKAELETDAKAPIEAYYAANSYVCRLNPAKFIGVLLPFFLLPFYFGVYQVWADTLFPESTVKKAVFQTGAGCVFRPLSGCFTAVLCLPTVQGCSTFFQIAGAGRCFFLRDCCRWRSGCCCGTAIRRDGLRSMRCVCCQDSCYMQRAGF